MIRLCICRSCKHVFDDKLIKLGWRCGCGSMMFSSLSPTKWNILRYILGHPIHAIKQIIAKEDDHE
jgi:hypothetical protein